jgi:AcrR family transcriptional regulator
MTESTREKLVEAARRCLIDVGSAGCTIKRIAAAAGVNHGLVHHYFGSKEELLLEVIRQEAAALREAMADREQRFVGEFAGPRIFRNPERLGLLMEFLSLARERPRIAKGLQEVLRLQRARIQEVLGLGDEKEAVIAIGALFGMAMQFAVDPTLPVEQAAEQFIAMIARNLSGARSG